MDDNLKGLFRSIRNRTALSPLATMREINAAHDERVQREHHYSQYIAKHGKMDRYEDRNGNPARGDQYPHVHIVESSNQDAILVIASRSAKDHPAQEKLPIGASGNEVHAAVARMARLL